MVWFLRVFGLKLRVDLYPFQLAWEGIQFSVELILEDAIFIIYSESVVFFRDEPNIDVLMEVEAISLVAGTTIQQSLQWSGLKQCIEFWVKV